MTSYAADCQWFGHNVPGACSNIRGAARRRRLIRPRLSLYSSSQLGPSSVWSWIRTRSGPVRVTAEPGCAWCTALRPGRVLPNRLDKDIRMTDERSRKRATVFRRDRYRCRLCGRPSDTAAFFVAPKYGGTDELSNLMSVCYTCRPASGSKRGERHDHPILPAMRSTVGAVQRQRQSRRAAICVPSPDELPTHRLQRRRDE
jgi:hypothetical protein